MNLFSSRSFFLALCLTLSAGANANLIVNGGFEEPAVTPGNWDYFSSGDVAGWDGSNIEIWNNYTYQGVTVTAAEGEQHAEINAHPDSGNFTISQSFSTQVGQSYDVSFSYRARANNSESFEFGLSDTGGAFSSVVLDDHTTSAWSVYEDSFVANDTTSSVWFSSITDGTIGNFIDDVSVTSSVPSPGTLVMMMIGLLGLGAARRQARR